MMCQAWNRVALSALLTALVWTGGQCKMLRNNPSDRRVGNMRSTSIRPGSIRTINDPSLSGTGKSEPASPIVASVLKNNDKEETMTSSPLLGKVPPVMGHQQERELTDGEGNGAPREEGGGTAVVKDDTALAEAPQGQNPGGSSSGPPSLVVSNNKLSMLSKLPSVRTIAVGVGAAVAAAMLFRGFRDEEESSTFLPPTGIPQMPEPKMTAPTTTAFTTTEVHTTTAFAATEAPTTKAGTTTDAATTTAAITTKAATTTAASTTDAPTTDATTTEAKLELIDTTTGLPIVRLEETGTVINLNSIDEMALSIRAVFPPDLKINKVKFFFDSTRPIQTESAKPYAINGDNGGDYLPFEGMTPGVHTVKANARHGTVIDSVSSTFTIIKP